jgi:pyruvate/2-oxoglutarate dehydrogenase complex dihydrolipoamide acyltransferase (E2) component
MATVGPEQRQWERLVVKFKLKLPRFGMNMEEATIVKWHKGVGESFVEGDAIYEVETDKVTQVVEATGGGTLVEILIPEGEDAQVGDAICVVEAG